MTELGQTIKENVDKSPIIDTDGLSISHGPNNLSGVEDADGLANRMPLASHHGEFSIFEHNYLNHYIQIADAKAGLCFTVASALLIYIFKQYDLAGVIVNFELAFSNILLALSGIILIASSIFSFMVVWPRTKYKKGGIIFWRSIISNGSAVKYLKLIANKTEGDIIAETINHCYELAMVADRKFLTLSRGMKLLALAVSIFIAFLVFK